MQGNSTNCEILSVSLIAMLIILLQYIVFDVNIKLSNVCHCADCILLALNQLSLIEVTLVALLFFTLTIFLLAEYFFRGQGKYLKKKIKKFANSFIFKRN